jgi:hypothetical protein
MTEQDLDQQRTKLWHTDGNAVRTVEDARGFIESVGFCINYPDRAVPLAPSFIGAHAGSAVGLPDVKHAFADPRAQEATDLMVRLLRERSAFEMNLSQETDLIISPALFPFFYAIVGDRNPKALPRKKAQGAAVSELSTRVFEALQNHGPLNKSQLQEYVGRESSQTALDRALGELWSILKITRVDYTTGGGVAWDVLYRWAPKMVKEGLNISSPEAISAVVSKYLETVVAAEQEEIEQFFSHITSRSKVRDAVNALLQARELSFLTIGTRTLIRMAEPTEQQRSRKHG